jgi:hypothetical protein
MSLPGPWVDRIFGKLSLVYGRDFLMRWEGLDLDAVKADWADALDGYEHYGAGALAYALEHLPAKPPTILEFRDIANRGPFKTDTPPLLPHSQTQAQRERSEQIRKDALAKLKVIADEMREAKKPDPKAWARRLLHREACGERLPPYSLKCAREALGIEPHQQRSLQEAIAQADAERDAEMAKKRAREEAFRQLQRTAPCNVPTPTESLPRGDAASAPSLPA